VSGGVFLGNTELFGLTDLTARSTALDIITILQAGEIGERLLTWRTAEIPADDRPAMTDDSALTRLAPDDAEFWRLALSEERSPALTDAQKAEKVAREIAGNDWEAFLSAGRARAWQLVADLAPVIVALIPCLLSLRFMSGNDLEEAMSRLTDADRQR
jgi:hypothetical protein